MRSRLALEKRKRNIRRNTPTPASSPGPSPGKVEFYLDPAPTCIKTGCRTVAPPAIIAAGA
ncbi:hypothetical protein NBRC116187_13260 [Halopseudomonas sabulinigri]|uniref:Uncharacterized protein n=1 Tax=Halopseudomonas sabulinigri TaxID=472181 RepID=A0ABP9ZND5_9GAMM